MRVLLLLLAMALSACRHPPPRQVTDNVADGETATSAPSRTAGERVAPPPSGAAPVTQPIGAAPQPSAPTGGPAPGPPTPPGPPPPTWTPPCCKRP
jgi:hypothetical protein